MPAANPARLPSLVLLLFGLFHYVDHSGAGAVQKPSQEGLHPHSPPLQNLQARASEAREWHLCGSQGTRNWTKRVKTMTALDGWRTVEAPVAFLELGIAPSLANPCGMRLL